MESKIILRNVMDKKPIGVASVEVSDQFDNEPIKAKLIDLLNNDENFKCFGQDGDVIEVEFQYQDEE